MVTLLCLVLASPLIQLRADQLAVAVLLDRSDSVSPAARDQQEQWLAKAMATKGTNDQVAVITFGEDATVERALSDDPRPPRLAPDAGGSRTDIAAAIRAGVAALPPERRTARWSCSPTAGKIWTTPIPRRPSASAAHVQLMSVPLDQSNGPEVLVRQLDAPTQLREGERFTRHRPGRLDHRDHAPPCTC